MSEATNFSSPFTPITIGLSFLATIILSGSTLDKTSIA